MKRLLLQLDSDRHPSLFEQIVAYDAGVDQVISYGVVPDEVAPLVHDAIFRDLHLTAIWVGGAKRDHGGSPAGSGPTDFLWPVPRVGHDGRQRA